MVLYYQSKRFIKPILIKPFIRILLLIITGNSRIKTFQYEKFYDIRSEKIKFIRYYISLYDKKIEDKIIDEIYGIKKLTT